MLAKKKNTRKTKKKSSLDTSNVIIVRHVKVPARESEKLKRLNEMLKNAELMD
jgi:hypothetical protein